MDLRPLFCAPHSWWDPTADGALAPPEWEQICGAASASISRGAAGTFYRRCLASQGIIRSKASSIFCMEVE